MRCALVALVLAACTAQSADPQPDAGYATDSLGAAETYAATAQCDRDRRCSSPDFDVDACVSAFVQTYCAEHDCLAAYSDWERLQVCVSDYDQYTCEMSPTPIRCWP